jgi:hypothetical protein
MQELGLAFVSLVFRIDLRIVTIRDMPRILFISCLVMSSRPHGFIFVVRTLEPANSSFRCLTTPESSNSVVPIPRCQEVVHDKIGNIATQSLTGRKVEQEVHPGKDAAQRRFFRGS